MLLFLCGIAVLIAGYFTYGKLVEKILGPDDRQTPCVKSPDGVDYIELPHWKNMLIQLLNIAGIGPVIGVILGIKFGSIVFVILPIGNLIAGATHDMIAGMMSLRNNGANLTTLVKDNLGSVYYRIFSWFMVILLLLVVAVFVNIPANLISGMIPGEWFWYAVAVITFYYVAAALFPVDKIIGAIYPFFGGLLIVSTLAIFGVLVAEGVKNPALLLESDAFKANMFTAEKNQPILPMLFVTIACGIISGFHATQSPIVARTMKTERQARSTFYGMMVAEGIIGMIWAGAGLAIYNLFPEYMAQAPAKVLSYITTHFLGSVAGNITILGVVVLAITSGDTALRSTRMALGEMLNIDQKPIRNRLLLCVSMLVVVAALLWWSNQSAKTFNLLWNYFSWGNQVLAVTTLLAGTVYLLKQRKNCLIALVPGAFMLFIVVCYILWISPAHGGPVGFGLPLNVAYVLAVILVAIASLAVWKHGRKLSK
ncbi:MAG: carbon starvation protein A [Lentisphaerae bacterium]|nr:carbon starvation protein A [Lentisphaerota bacterium]